MRRRHTRPAALAALLLVLAGAAPAGAAEVLLRVGNLDVPAGTVVHGDAIAVGGSLGVEGTVEGNAVAVGGTVDVRGQVLGSVRAIGGNVILRSTAVIDGTATAWPGRVQIEPGASVARGRPSPPASGAPPAPAPSFPVPEPPFQWWWGPGMLAVSAAFHLLYWLIVLLAWLTAVLFPGATGELAALLERTPGAALGLGVLAWVILWPVVVVLAVSVVGLVLVVLIPAIVLVMLQFGLTAVALLIGRRMRQPGLGREALVGSIMLAIAFAIPQLGALLAFAAATWGWGAVLLALADRVRMRRAPPPSPPAPAQSA